MLLRLIALSSLAFSSALSAADVPKQPTGKWVAEYNEDECLLSRSFGSDANILILSFRGFPMDDYIRVIVFKSGTAGDTNTDAGARLGFGGEPIKTMFSAFDLAGKPVRRIEMSVKRSDLMAATESGVVSVDVPGEVKGSFAVPELGSALDVLTDCSLKLGAAWGIPTEQQKRMKAPAKLNGLPFTPDDFPESALKQDMGGRTEVRMTIDEQGQPIDCIPLKSTPNAVFARTSCNVLRKRAHFKPAIDVDGHPMKSLYVETVTFLIGG